MSAQRHSVTCDACGYRREHIGALDDAQRVAERMGWKIERWFGVSRYGNEPATTHEGVSVLCPHCKLLPEKGEDHDGL